MYAIDWWNHHHKKSLSATVDEVSIDVDQLETKSSVTDHRREESIDSTADIYDL